MSKVILQPCGDAHAIQHYEETIAQPVTLDSIRHCLSDEEFDELSRVYPDGNTRIWGVTPGAKGVNARKWDRIHPGDVTLIARNGAIFASAVTTYKTHNLRLATHLWGDNGNGATWEYVYFVSEVKRQQIPYLDFNQAVGYQPNYIIQGFNVLDEQKSISVLEVFDLNSETYYPEATVDDLDEVLKNYDSLDFRSNTPGRKEQAIFRRRLFDNAPFADCCICKRKYPVEFLVTAHIKKRARCSDSEKRDLKVVAPMCKFGCDDLYEKGYVAVRNGIVENVWRGDITSYVEDYIADVAGNSCLYWNNQTEGYFNWHYDWAMSR